MAIYARFVLVFLLCFVFLTPTFCQQQDENKGISSVVGQVVDVDWVASKLTVKYFSNRPGHSYDELNFVITNGTTIIKGTEIVGFSDVNQSDQVVVEYYPGSLAGLQAVKITVEI